MDALKQRNATASDVYHPASRRPIAKLFRNTAHWATAFCVRTGIRADWISYSSMVVSAAAGICFAGTASYPLLLIIGPLLCYGRLWLNMLDGMVAIAAGTASPRGEILNDLPDRVSDVLIFVGVAHSGLAHPYLGYWGAIFALLTAYVGMLGQAVVAKRQYGGIMSKPWRMVTLHVGAWAQYFWLIFRGEKTCLWSLTMLDFACAVVILGCVQTIAVRLRRILGELDRPSS